MKKIIVFGLSAVFLTGVFAVAAPASAVTLSEIQAQIQSLLNQIKQLEISNQSATAVDSVTDWCFNFKSNLRRGDTGKQVANLHTALQKEGYAIDKGEISNKRFGDSTKKAVIAFQEKYASEILTPINETQGTGIVANTTRAKLNQLYGCSNVAAVTTVPIPTVTPTVIPTITASLITNETTIPVTAPTPATNTTITAKSATLAISVSNDPSARRVIAGSRANFADYLFDTMMSSEDVQFPSIPLKLESGGKYSGAPNNLTDCMLYDVSTALNAGVNAVDPSGSATTTDTTPTFIFNNPFIVPKGVIKSLGLQCEVSSASHTGSTYQWGIEATPAITVTGVTSGDDVMEAVTASDGPVATVARNGTFTIGLDSSSPFPQIVKAGEKNIIAAVLRTESVFEDIRLNRIASQLEGSNRTAVERYTVWDGATKVGEGVFTSSNYSTTTLTGKVFAPKNGSKLLTLKIDLVSDPELIHTGDTIALNYDGNDPTGTSGIGLESGAVIYSSSKYDTNASTITIGDVFTPTPSITVLSPNGGESWEVGKTYNIKWNTANINIPSETTAVVDLVLNWNNESQGKIIGYGQPDNDSYNWTISSEFLPRNDYKIRANLIQLLPNGSRYLMTYDLSDAPFSIVAKDNWCYDFQKNLKKGDVGKDIAALHIALEKEGFAISQNEKKNQRFGNSTGAAVIAFQEKYKGEILEPVKEKKGTGFVGKTTRTKLNQLYGCDRTGSLAISVSSSPVAQTIIRGSRVTFANYYFDATQSSEDIYFPSIPLKLESGEKHSGAPNNLTDCTLYDGSTALNTGINAIDPLGSATTTDSIPTFIFNNPFIVPKGVIKTLGLQCEVSSASPSGSTYQWGIEATPFITVTGMTSGKDIAETVTPSDGQVMTVTGNGILTVSFDWSTPPYTIVAAGTSNVTLGKLKFHAANEAINLSRVALQLTNAASSSVTDLTGVSLWGGSTQVGSAVFTTTRFATSTLTSVVIVPKDGDKILTVKGNLANIGASQPGRQGALIAVDYDGDDQTGTRGIGQESGGTINSSSRNDTKSAGVRMFKSFPTFAKLPVSSTTLLGGSGAEVAKSLYRLSVKADSHGSIGIYKFTAHIATTSLPLGATTSVTNLRMKAYTDPYFSSPVNGFGEGGTPAGQLNNTISALDFNIGTTTILMNASTQGTGKDYLQIPAGATYYFDLLGDIAYTNGVTSAAVQTRIEGDRTYPYFRKQDGTDQMSNVEPWYSGAYDRFRGDRRDFIWSPNATTSSLTTHSDWTNGYFVPGLPSDNMDSQTLIK